MTVDDRRHWDERWAADGPAPVDHRPPPPALADVADLLPTSGTALELACGRGRGAVWLAGRGLDVWAVDVSAVAIGLAHDLAVAHGLAERCRFDVVDLDEGLPPGPAVDVVLCHLFRDARLDTAVVDRVRPGGVLAMVVLSEVGAGPGRFRAAPGELLGAFGHLDVLHHREGDGQAALVARRTSPSS